MVTVCPGGQVLLTCRINGSILYWDVSVPRAIPRERFVQSQGVILSPDFKIGFTEFNITRTSGNPLISQLLINNVTTEINGSTIYCSEDGDENNAPMTAISVNHKGMIITTQLLILLWWSLMKTFNNNHFAIVKNIVPLII
jgi:hypothetical protein